MMLFPDRSMRCSWVKTFMMLAAGNSHESSPPANAPISSRYPSLHVKLVLVSVFLIA